MYGANGKTAAKSPVYAVCNSKKIKNSTYRQEKSNYEAHYQSG